ncbi:MAG TPA: glycoside hydrolase family 31 protein [Anaerolineaceae bacterium]|nr:glycoside hydrolase family 31 protein [Anaerolineaceae bacterium]HPN50115.1 glycoside hydrolase family 31 protein [Anaerolineaceae bacterium]
MASHNIPAHFRLNASPVADPGAVVTEGEARFSILTPRLIRMEYSQDRRFEDRPSQVFWHRRQPVPDFKVRQTETILEIETTFLKLTYQKGKKFSRRSLQVTLLENGQTWHYGDADALNLKGTARTLDEVNGHTRLEDGLVSRSGWVVVDESQNLVYNEKGWLELREGKGRLDLTFLGYGMDYRGCLQEMMRVAGETPLIPRWALGNWWSRFWAYTQDELSQLMLAFKEHEIPLAVCIVDMDWHITRTGNQSSGWTGYTWNDELFPDHQAFIHFLHGLGLKTALNLHPADGVYPHEAAYPVMAQAVGQDPQAGEPVRFDLENPDFARPYFEILHHPMEAEGVDFWWMDWQQGNPVRLKGLNLLWWINHLHFMDLGRDPRKRPFVFSRWGGLGNHRMPIGFSGDTIVSWESLAYQPYFTATAANVGYGWWSHDIGGHMSGMEDPELYTRWVQYGVFSPIMRLHSTNNPFLERCPWGYDAEVERIARKAMQFRHALIPYLYSMAWRNHVDGLPLCLPMYYTHPRQEEAYHCESQYWFGDQLLAMPFTSKANPETNLARQEIWLPEGDWFDFFQGHFMTGDGWRPVYGQLEDIPVYARAGAIVPLGPLAGWGNVDAPDTLEVHVFAGADGHFSLYEDDGDSQAYLKGDYHLVEMKLEWMKQALAVAIGPEWRRRDYRLVIHGVARPETLTCRVNERIHPSEWQYDAASHILTMDHLSIQAGERLNVTMGTAGEDLLVRDEQKRARLEKMLRAFRAPSDRKRTIFEHCDEVLAGNMDTLDELSPAQWQAISELVSGQAAASD